MAIEKHEIVELKEEQNIYFKRQQLGANKVDGNINHFHDLLEITFILNAKGKIVFSGDTIELKQQQVIIIPPLVVHEYLFNLEVAEYFVLLIPKSTLTEIGIEHSEELFTKVSSLELKGESQARLLQLFNRLEMILENNESLDSCNATLRQSMDFILNEINKVNGVVTFKEGKVSKGMTKIAPLIKILERQKILNISLEDAATSCALSRYYFSRMFKEAFKIPFSEYLLERKVSFALNLMKDDNLSITEVSRKSGFNDLPYFSKMFKRYVGKTPSEVKRQSTIRDKAKIN